VLELMGGKATVDQLARRYGVKPETVEGWRQDAMDGLEAALRRGNGRSGRELELEKENRELRGAVTDLSIEKAILKRELDKCRPPSVPARSRR
jgi:transposase-like protein